MTFKLIETNRHHSKSLKTTGLIIQLQIIWEVTMLLYSFFPFIKSMHCQVLIIDTISYRILTFYQQIKWKHTQMNQNKEKKKKKKKRYDMINMKTGGLNGMHKQWNAQYFFPFSIGISNLSNQKEIYSINDLPTSLTIKYNHSCFHISYL